MTNQQKYWNLFGCILVVVVIAGSLAPLDAPPINNLSDKWHHLIAYAGITGWFVVGAASSAKARALILILSCALGTAIEVLQPIIANRVFDIADIAANICGASIGLACGILCHKLVYPRLASKA